MDPIRNANADVSNLIKQLALNNLRHTTPDDILFIVAVLAIALIALLLINKGLLSNSMQLKQPTIPSFFVATYFVLMSLPAILWFYADTRDPIRYTYFIAIQSVLVTFPIGVFFAKALTPESLRVTKEPFLRPLQQSEEDRYAVRYWVLMLGASLLVATVYLVTSPYVPLIGALTSYGDLAATDVRRAIVADGAAVHYGHALTARLLLPFCLLYSYFMAYLYGGRWRWLFWPTLAVAAFVSTLTFDRMFPFSVVLYLVLAVYFKHSDQAARTQGKRRDAVLGMARLRLAGYVAALLFVAMLVGGIVSLTQFNQPLGRETITDTSSSFFVNRVLLDPSFMAYIYFDEFNSPDTFLYGTGFHVLISQLFGIEFRPTISPSFVAELWMNFGWYGVLLGSVLVGFGLQTIQAKVFDRKSVTSLALFIILALNGAWIIYGHLLATMVISVYLPGILILIHLKRRRHEADYTAGRLAPRLRQVVRYGR